jgi:hypothetical protein
MLNLNSFWTCTVHRGAFCQFPFQWIYYWHSSKFTGNETGKIHLCAVVKHWVMMIWLSAVTVLIQNLTFQTPARMGTGVHQSLVDTLTVSLPHRFVTTTFFKPTGVSALQTLPFICTISPVIQNQANARIALFSSGFADKLFMITGKWI